MDPEKVNNADKGFLVVAGVVITVAAKKYGPIIIKRLWGSSQKSYT